MQQQNLPSIKKINPILQKTFGNALDEYIADRASILSPATVREYKRSRKADLQDLMDVRICDMTQELIQISINNAAKNHSSKSVRNMHGLLSAVMKVYRPDFALNTALPKKGTSKHYSPYRRPNKRFNEGRS